jgi:CRP-like cAMP-binding protein
MEIKRREVEWRELGLLPLFEGLDPPTLKHLSEGFTECRVEAGEYIFRDGEDADAFFIILRGAMAVFRDVVGQPVQLLARLGAQEFFGELGLFGTGRHTASVRASEESVVLRIGREEFLVLLEDHPRLMEKLQLAAAQRHSANVASTLELGRRREVRIRTDQEVEIELESRSGAVAETLSVRVENLSLGGICLSGAPEPWREGAKVRFYLLLRDNRLPLGGRVVWRRGDSLGVVFTDHDPNHDTLVQLAIRLLVELKA